MKGKRKLIERINAWFLVILMVISIIPFNVFRIRAKADSQTNGYSITVKDEAGALIDGVNIEYLIKAGSKNKSGNVVTINGIALIADITSDLIANAATDGTTVTMDIIATKDGYVKYTNNNIQIVNDVDNIDIEIHKKAIDDTFAFTLSTAEIKYGEDFTNTATSSKTDRTGTVTYSVESGDECVSVDNDGAITTLKAGSATIKAVLPEDENYQESQATYTLTINKADDSNFEFSDPAPGYIIYSENGTYVNKASGGYGKGDITYEIISGDDYATVDNDGTLHLLKAGSVVVEATRAADDKYKEVKAQYTIEIKKASQKILQFEIETPEDAAITDGTFSNEASGGSGTGQIIYEITTGSEYASIEDNTSPVITLKKIGTIVVKATKLGDERYEDSSPITYTLTIKKAQQEALEFLTTNPEITYSENWTYTVEASGGSTSSAIAYYIVDNGNRVTENDIASIDTATGIVKSKGYRIGIITVEAVKGADDIYEEASIACSITIKKANQTEVKFNKNTDKVTYGENNNEYNNVAIGGQSTSDIKYSVKEVSNTQSGVPCAAVDADTGKVTIKGSGTITVVAVRNGDDCYLDSNKAYYTLTIDKAEQKDFKFDNNMPQSIKYNENNNEYTLATTGGNGDGEVKYSIVSGDAITIDGNKIKVKKAGKVTIRAEKASSDGYKAAFDELTIDISPAEQSIKFNDTNTQKVIYGNDFSNAAVPVENISVPDKKGYAVDTVITYKVIEGVNIAEVDNNGKLKFKDNSIGTVTVQAVKAGNNCYAATQAVYTIQVEYLETPSQPYTISGEKSSDNIWYRGDVTIIPAAGYKVSYSNNLTNNIWEDSLKITEDGSHTKKIYLKNELGITGTINISSDEIKIDKTKPQNLTISYSKSVHDILLQGITFGFYKAPVKVTIEAEDLTSGIKSFAYSYKVDNGVSDVNAGKSDVVIAQGDNAFKSDGNKAQAVFEIPAQFRGKVDFTATDSADNKSDICIDNDKTIVVDEITKGVSVSYDNNDVKNSSYYKADRTATISIDEDNFFVESLEKSTDASRPDEIISEHLNIAVTSINDEGVTTSKKYQNKDDFKEWFNKGSDGIWRASIEFTEEGDYTLNIQYSDFSGNEAKPYTNKFTIDKTAPQVSIELDKKDAINGEYYYRKAKADIVIKEHNFDPSDINVNCVTKDADDKSVNVKDYQKLLREGNWEQQGNTYTLRNVEFDTDAIYSLKIDYKDMAGNSQQKEAETEFCVDKEKPENLTISYSKSKKDVILQLITFGYYKAPVTVTIAADDKTSGIKSFTYSYEVEEGTSTVNTGKKDIVISEGDKNFKSDKSKAQAVFEIPAQFRGKVSFTATDKAENVSEVFKDTKTTVVDDIKPEINITIDGKNKSNQYEEYYKDYPVTANIQIKEANFDKDSDDLKIKVTTELNDGTLSEKTYKDKDLTTGFSYNDKDDIWVGSIELNNEYESKDAKYIVSVEYTDYSGNAADKVAKQFIVDKTDPVIKVDYSNNDVRNDKYFNADRTARITIIEHNFNSNDVELKVTNNKAVDNVADFASYLKNPSSWTNNGDIHEAEIPFTVEAYYTFDISYTDMSGRKNTYVDYGNCKAVSEFVIDKTAPVNSDITIDSSSVLAVNGIAFERFYRNDITLKFTTDADISGIKSIKYQKINQLADYDVNGIWNNYDSQNGVLIKPSEKFVIYFRVEDMSGNVSIVNSTGIVVDDKAPSGESAAPQIDILPGVANKNGLHNSNVNVAMKVIDPKYSGNNQDVNGYYSGINKITYRIYTRDTDAVETGTLLDIASDNVAGAIYDNDKLISSWNGNIVIDSQKFNSNNVILELTAFDNAGNERVTNNEMIGQYIKIDTTSPIIDVSYDNNVADNNVYFKESRTARIQITERNFNADDVNISIVNTDGVIPSISGWEQNSGSGNMDDTTWVTYVTYDADGDYSFDINYSDMADNASQSVNYAEETIAANEFTIDKTLPVIEVNYDNNEASNDNYYKSDRVATITITEHNFQADRVNVNITAMDDGNAVSTPDISGWSSDGDRNTATINYNSDAYYTFSVSTTDMAGNISEEFAEQNFYIDKTLPELSITGIDNNTANSGTVMPVVSYSDTNYDESMVSITLTGANRKSVELDGAYSDQHNGRVFTFNNFDNNKTIDDIYTLDASITDKAGNTSTQIIVFSVNRFGSTYELSTETEFLNGKYVKQAEDIIISEVNVDRLNNIRLILYKNDETINLKENVDYQINITGGNGEWYHYTYVIFAKNFTDNGVYRLTIQSDDETGRTQKTDQDTKNVEIQFGIDDEAPIINVKNLDSRSTYAVEDKDVELTVRDNLKLSKVIVELDGNEYRVWSDDELDQIVKDGGNFTFNINGDSTSAHNLLVYAVDAAGNGEKAMGSEAPSNIVNISDFYVTTNKWVQYFNNKPLFYGSIIGVVVLAGLAVTAITLKKRKLTKEL